MKKILLALIVLFSFTGMAFSQIENPVKWTYTSKKLGDKLYELQITATLQPGWHIYAQDAGEGPEATSFTFTANPLFKLEDKVKEQGKLIKEYDPNFKSVLKFYGNKVVFTQKIKMKTAVPTVAKGTVTYMVCNDKKCLPPKDIPFSIKVGGK